MSSNENWQSFMSTKTLRCLVQDTKQTPQGVSLSPLSAAPLSARHHLSFIWINATGSWLGFFFFISVPENQPRVFWILSSCLNTLRKTLSGNKKTICCSSSDAYDHHTCTVVAALVYNHYYPGLTSVSIKSDGWLRFLFIGAVSCC